MRAEQNPPVDAILALESIKKRLNTSMNISRTN
jgi:hypothetical protein